MTQQSSGNTNRRVRTAFTLVELLVVIAIIAMLVTLLVPAVQSAREAARRVQCINNLKQIGLGFLNHHSAREEFPFGAYTDQPPVGRATVEAWGSAWTVFILPYVEESSLFDQMVFGPGGSGWPAGHNYAVVGDTRVEIYQCPSSPLTTRSTVGNPVWDAPVPDMSPRIMTNHFAGISGFGIPQTGQQEFDIIGFNELRKVPKASFGTSSGGGLLFAGGNTKIAKVTDGTSKTMLVSEQNDLLFANDRQALPIGTGIPYGWLIGSNKSRPPFIEASGDWRAHQCTTVRYSINQKTGWPFQKEFGQASSDSNRTGVGVIGSNIPLNSAHPGGINTLFADGSVRFQQDNLSLSTLAKLATRDDGLPVSDSE